MKTELKAKYLQYLNQSKPDEGFTLIELLVVIIIIGILSAIALPAFLNQANKAKQSEAKTYVGSMVRAQQTHYLEKNYFANNDKFGDLGLGIKTETANYSYVIASGATAPLQPGSSAVTNQARQKAEALKAYIGGVNVGVIADTSEATTLGVVCETEVAQVVDKNLKGQDETNYTTAGPTCPNKYVDLGAP